MVITWCNIHTCLDITHVCLKYSQICVRYQDSAYITGVHENLQRSCTALLHAVADLSAEHTDLHMEEEEWALPSMRFILLLSLSALLHRLPAWKWHPANPSSFILPLASPSSLGFPRVLWMSLPNASTLQPPPSLCEWGKVRELRKWFALFIHAGGISGCILILQTQPLLVCVCTCVFVCVCVCVCVCVHALLFSATTSAMLLSAQMISKTVCFVSFSFLDKYYWNRPMKNPNCRSCNFFDKEKDVWQ